LLTGPRGRPSVMSAITDRMCKKEHQLIKGLVFQAWALELGRVKLNYTESELK